MCERAGAHTDPPNAHTGPHARPGCSESEHPTVRENPALRCPRNTRIRRTHVTAVPPHPCHGCATSRRTRGADRATRARAQTRIAHRRITPAHHTRPAVKIKGTRPGDTTRTGDAHAPYDMRGRARGTRHTHTRPLTICADVREHPAHGHLRVATPPRPRGPSSRRTRPTACSESEHRTLARGAGSANAHTRPPYDMRGRARLSRPTRAPLTICVRARASPYDMRGGAGAPPCPPPRRHAGPAGTCRRRPVRTDRSGVDCSESEHPATGPGPGPTG